MPDYVYAVDLDYTSTFSITTECQPHEPEISEDMDTALEQDPEHDKDKDSDADDFDLVSVMSKSRE